MTRQLLVELTRRTVAHACAGTAPLADTVTTVPARHYVDPQRWELERERIFRRVPLVAAATAELPRPGDHRAVELAGVPVLVTRAEDGGIRALLNRCSHRGAPLTEPGCGHATRLTCPYHGWSYRNDGTLVSVRNGRDFGPVDTDQYGLVELPCAERAGLVFVGLDPSAPLRIDEFLCGYDAALSHLGLADHLLVGRQELAGPNWKVAYDGYLDFYHLPVLHKATFGDSLCDRAVYDAWGPHQRVSAPDASMAKLAGVPEEQWRTSALTIGVWTVFPHVSIARFDAGGPLIMVSQLLPGPTVDRSTTVQLFLAPHPPDEQAQQRIDEMITFLRRVVGDEDYAMGLAVQRGLVAGGRDHVLFGRNELGGQRFHRFVDELVAAPDDRAYAALLARSRVEHQP
ncbi:MAG: aromatic ring-hydroxylating dioxygenase subunit alpha [Acidimicrobiales bacterium]